MSVCACPLCEENGRRAKVLEERAVAAGRYVRWGHRETGEPMDFPEQPGSWHPCPPDTPGAMPDLNWAATQGDPDVDDDVRERALDL